MIDPLPCPRCGMMPEVDTGLSDAPHPPGHEFVSCPTWLVGIPGIPDQACGTHAEGIAAWNRRAPAIDTPENKPHMTRLWQEQVCARTKSELRRVDAERRAEAAEAEVAALTAQVGELEGAQIVNRNAIRMQKTKREAAEAERDALRERVARLEGALRDMPKAVLRTTICQGPQWPDDRPGVWLAALEACAKSVQTAVNAALPAADARPVQDDAASRRRKIMGYMDAIPAADARAEVLKEAGDAWAAYKAANTTVAHWEAVARLDAALIPEKKP